MPALTFSPSKLSFTLVVPGDPYTPAAVRAVTAAALLQSDSRQAIVAGANATLSVDGGAPSWLTVPAGSVDGIAFAVAVSSVAIEPGLYSATIRATAGGFSDATCDATFRVDFEGHPMARRTGNG